MTQYQGPIVRDAREGDPNYDPYKDQVVINMRNGGEMVVERHEVSGQRKPAATSAKPVAPGPPVEVNHDYDDGSKSFIKGTGPQSGATTAEQSARENARRAAVDQSAADRAAADKAAADHAAADKAAAERQRSTTQNPAGMGGKK